MNDISLKILRKIRKAERITQEEMASRLGYSGKQGYCELENGRVEMTVNQLVKIKEILNLSDDEVICYFLSSSQHIGQSLKH